MKKLLFLFALIVSAFSLSAQSPTYQVVLGHFRMKFIIIDSVVQVPSYRTVGRPAANPAAQIIYNIDSAKIQYSDGSNWTSVNLPGGAGGGGGVLVNVGPGYRLAIAGTSNIKTLNPGYAFKMDSTSMANTITMYDDTTKIVPYTDTLKPGGIATQTYVNGQGFLKIELDPVAIAKTITLTQGNGVTITGTPAQTIGSNPTYGIKADTSIIATQAGLGNKLNKFDTTAMLVPYLHKNDTAAMLAPYGRLIFLVKYSDTASMLFPYARSNLVVKYSDTAGMLAVYARNIFVVKYSDTAGMLGAYARSIFFMRYTDTAAMLAPYARNNGTTFVRYTDTAAMFAPYLRKIDTTNMLVPYLRNNVAAATYYLQSNPLNFIPLSAITATSYITFPNGTGIIKADTSKLATKTDLTNYLPFANINAQNAARMAYLPLGGKSIMWTSMLYDSAALRYTIPAGWSYYTVNGTNQSFLNSSGFYAQSSGQLQSWMKQGEIFISTATARSITIHGNEIIFGNPPTANFGATLFLNDNSMGSAPGTAPIKVGWWNTPLILPESGTFEYNGYWLFTDSNSVSHVNTRDTIAGRNWANQTFQFAGILPTLTTDQIAFGDGANKQTSSPNLTYNAAYGLGLSATSGYKVFNSSYFLTDRGRIPAATVNGNVIIGPGAYNNAATGISNTGLGVNVLQFLTSGYSNTAVGNGAGNHITTGGQNEFYGLGAGNLLTTGNFNIGIGYSALPAITTGWDNLQIGILKTGITITGASDRNILIGEDSFLVAANASNMTYIGHGYTVVRNNTANFGTPTQVISLGKGGMTTAQYTALGTTPTFGDIYFNKDTADYIRYTGIWHTFGGTPSAAGVQNVTATFPMLSSGGSNPNITLSGLPNAYYKNGLHVRNDSTAVAGGYVDSLINLHGPGNYQLDSLTLLLTGPRYVTAQPLDTNNYNLLVRKKSDGSVINMPWQVPAAGTSAKTFVTTAAGTNWTNSVAISSTLIGTGVGSLGIAANTLVVGSSFIIKGTFQIQTNTGVQGLNIFFYPNAGGTGSGNTITIPGSSTPSTIFFYELIGTVLTTGTSGTMAITARLESLVTGAGALQSNTYQALYINNQSFNSTVTNTFDLKAQWGGQSTNNQIQLLPGAIFTLYP